MTDNVVDMRHRRVRQRAAESPAFAAGLVDGLQRRLDESYLRGFDDAQAGIDQQLLDPDSAWSKNLAVHRRWRARDEGRPWLVRTVNYARHRLTHRLHELADSIHP